VDSSELLIDNEGLVAAILMMASQKDYFNYEVHLRCGIPSVTLAGTKDDWVEIFKRLERFESWDEQTMVWTSMLRPILRKFIAAFDGRVDRDFWGRIVSNQ